MRKRKGNRAVNIAEGEEVSEAVVVVMIEVVEGEVAAEAVEMLRNVEGNLIREIKL